MMQLGSIFLKDKEAAIPEVKRWLLETYDVVPGAMVPKKQVYDAYRAFCAQSGFEPCDVSSFGKLFKRVFPDVERKRLVKGWHYCNLAPRVGQAATSTASASSATSALMGSSSTAVEARTTSSTAPMDRLYHSDPIVPTTVQAPRQRFATAGQPISGTRPLSPPPRPHSRSSSSLPSVPQLSPSSGFVAVRSRSPSPSSAMVRRAHSQSPVSSSHHVRPRGGALSLTPPSLSPAGMRPVSPRLVQPVPIYYPIPQLHGLPLHQQQQNLLPPYLQIPVQPQPQPLSSPSSSFTPHHQLPQQHPPSQQPLAPQQQQQHVLYSPLISPVATTTTTPTTTSPAPVSLHSSPSFSPYPAIASTGHYFVRRTRSRTATPTSMEVEMADSSSSTSTPTTQGNHNHHEPSPATSAMATLSLSNSSPGTAMIEALTSGTHHQLMSEVEYYMDIYRREIWGFHPVNPAALETDRLRYLLTTDGGAKERSPLALCAYFALSAGSTFAGDFRRGREYLNKLRAQVSEMFDASDYDVACVLRHLAQLARLYADGERDGREKCDYYLTLSLQICERIGAINDENYLIALKLRSIYFSVDVEDKLVAAFAQPRWRKQWVVEAPFIENYPQGKLTEITRDHFYEIPKNIFLLIDPPFTYASQVPLHDGLTEQIDRLDELEDKLGGLQESFGKLNTLHLLRAFLFAIRTTCHAAIHQVDDALESAVDFVQILPELTRPCQAACLVELCAKPLYMQALVQTLLQAERYDLLQELTGVARPLSHEFGAISDFCRQLLDHLEAHQRSRGPSSPPFPWSAETTTTIIVDKQPSTSPTSATLATSLSSSPPTMSSSPPSISVPQPPIFPLYSTTPHALPTVPPLLGSDSSLYLSTSSSSSLYSSSSSSGGFSVVPSMSSSATSSAEVAPVISPERPEGDDDVERLTAYLSAFFDQHM